MVSHSSPPKKDAQNTLQIWLAKVWCQESRQVSITQDEKKTKN